MSNLDSDWRIRLAAFAKLKQLRESKGGIDIATREELERGFEFEGERIRLIPPRQGIWKPRQCSAALSFVTIAPKPGRPAPYDDQLDEDTGFFVYKYQGTDVDNSANRAMRRAMEMGRPLVYLIGLVPATYQVLFPVFITGESRDRLQFRVEKDVDVAVLDPWRLDVNVRAPDREYATRAVKVRLHQRRFRSLVIGAYRTRCAICSLRHERLLDAAHILEDRHERGLPEVPNGLALCKIHHSAYDGDILGIDPDYTVHVNGRVLEEKDGPMLEHGLKQMHGARLIVPASAALRPNRDFLAERFARWEVA